MLHDLKFAESFPRQSGSLRHIMPEVRCRLSSAYACYSLRACFFLLVNFLASLLKYMTGADAPGISQPGRRLARFSCPELSGGMDIP
jgi:hypothetical protein